MHWSIKARFVYHINAGQVVVEIGPDKETLKESSCGKHGVMKVGDGRTVQEDLEEWDCGRVLR